MSVRLIIVCEGQTEYEFCIEVLCLHLMYCDVHATPVILKHANGGHVRWDKVRVQILNHLKHEPAAFVTTFVDYYGITDIESWPGFSAAQSKADPYDKIATLQEAMAQAIPDGGRFRFLPYVQLHEFEALLFSDPVFLGREAMSNSNIAAEAYEAIVTAAGAPELINDNRATCPSRRIMAHFAGYSKTVHGSLICKEIGIGRIREACPGLIGG